MAEKVGLNAGGKIYKIERFHLDNKPASIFAKNSLSKYPTDQDGNYLLNVDGERFRYILNYIKYGDIHLPPGFNDFDLLCQEAKQLGMYDHDMDGRIQEYCTNYNEDELPRFYYWERKYAFWILYQREYNGEVLVRRYACKMMWPR